jgi:2-polyprenyl-6-methoxyphenol hydroxylase-like FAD-dependent oxidoreductase
VRGVSARWDVVVVGGRLSGSATAMLLARAGMRVLCLDRARHGSDTVSTHALMRAGVLQLSRWGLMDQIRAAGTPPVHRIVFHYGDETVRISVRPGPGVDALYAPRRTVLDPVLADAASRAGATLRHGTAVSGLLRADDGRVTGVVVEGAREERAPLVIGADGRNSVVADAVGAPVRHVAGSATDWLYGYWADLPVDGYTWYYRPGVTLGAIPTNDGLTCVLAGSRPEVVRPLVGAGGPESAVRALAGPSPLGSLLRRAGRASGVRFFRGAPGRLRVPHGPGWALVGDAGYWEDPQSTHGMTAALRDAELLARAVLRAPHPGRAQTAALGEFAAQRDALAVPMMRVVERLAAHDWDLPTVRELLMEMASTMTDEVELLQALPAAA